MPIPVSRTAKRSGTRSPSGGPAGLTVRATSPCSVNLTALASRFASTWRSRVTSPSTTVGTPGSISPVRSSALPPAAAATRSRAVSTHVAQRERLVLQLELPGLDLAEVQDVVDDDEQGVAAAADRLDVVALLVVQRGVEQEPGHPDDGVHRRPDLVRHGGEEGRLRLVGRLGLAAGVVGLPLAQGDGLALARQGRAELVQPGPDGAQLARPRRRRRGCGAARAQPLDGREHARPRGRRRRRGGGRTADAGPGPRSGARRPRRRARPRAAVPAGPPRPAASRSAARLGGGLALAVRVEERLAPR